MSLMLWVGVGGALGAVARYGIGSWTLTWAGTSLPWGTLVVNLVGSFLLGAGARAFQTFAVPPDLRVAITVGFLGAFTTFSTYSYETLTLLQQGEWERAVAYGIGSLVVGVALVAAGFAGAELVLAR